MIEFRESAIESITEDLDGKAIYVGTESGDLAAFWHAQRFERSQ